MSGGLFDSEPCSVCGREPDECICGMAPDFPDDATDIDDDYYEWDFFENEEEEEEL